MIGIEESNISIAQSTKKQKIVVSICDGQRSRDTSLLLKSTETKLGSLASIVNVKATLVLEAASYSDRLAS